MTKEEKNNSSEPKATKDKEKIDIEIARHSSAHVTAAAIQELYPGAKFGVGPVIEDGFYYDIEFSSPISDDDLKNIEKKAREIIKKGTDFKRSEMPVDEAIKFFKKEKQDYKVELLTDLKKKGTTKVGEEELEVKADKVSLYETGGFVDLCRGPHIENTKSLKPEGYKLTKLAGAYWRGDDSNPMLTRVYGLYFHTKDELQKYLKMLEEAQKRDHRKLGKELDLFVFSDMVGPGLPLYTPRGTVIRNAIADYSRNLRYRIGYQEVHTPQINKAELFKTSGHYDKYKEDMFEVHSHYSEDEYFLKPMNCPQHTQIYASQMRSYRDLPVRIADFANLYRDEKPGELSGLTRLRAFSQDDGHCFCREDQIKDEFVALLSVIEEAMRVYGLDYHIRLSLRDENAKEKYLGDDKTWSKAQKVLKELLEEKKIDHVVAEGEAAFYGPKMDLMARDALGREWQISTIQLDFNMPGRFGLEYTDDKGKKQIPVMIHAAIVGSPERFMGILLEHYAGGFPLWLAPVQVKVLQISEKFAKYATKVTEELRGAGIRVELDDREESLGKKIREAETNKIPYMIIIGEKEEKDKKLAVRSKKDGDQGTVDTEELIEKLKEEIGKKQ